MSNSNFVPLDIMSNSLKGDFKDNIVNRTLDDMYESIKTVYGPFGTDVFLKVGNNPPYYTRDGKEVVESLLYSNSLSMDVRDIMYQAIERQANVAGDGTTTLVMLYINIYREIMTNETLRQVYSTSEIRREYQSVVKKIVEILRSKTEELNDNEFKSMLYTCTQDPELTTTIFNHLNKEISSNSYILVNRSDYEDEFVVTKQDRPFLKCDKIYSSKHVADSFKLDHAVLLYVDGPLDIRNESTIHALANYGTMPGCISNRNIIFLSHGITDVTKETIAKCGNLSDEMYNNIIVMRLDNYLSITDEIKEDISSYIYNIPECTGLIQYLNFEAHIVRSLFEDIDSIKNQYESERDIPSAYTFIPGAQNLDRMKECFHTTRPVEYSYGDGLKIDGELNETATIRFKEIKDAIEKEKSPIKRSKLQDRMKRLFGSFIEIKVGAKMIKDSQRKFELILDAIISSQQGFKHGVLKNNSLIETLKAIFELGKQSPLADSITQLLLDAVVGTIIEIINNKYTLTDTDRRAIKNYLVMNAKDITQFNLYEDCRHLDFVNDAKKLMTTICKGGYDEEGSKVYIKILTEDNSTIDVKVIEPFTIIENLLLNSTIAVDLALSKMFVVNDFNRNYI